MTARRFRSRCLELLVVVVLVVPKAALAQACCAGTSAFAPARLLPHEDALVGLQLRAGALVGSWDATRSFIASPPGATELRLEEVFVGSVRFLSRGQATVTVPFMETWRRLNGLSEGGGGLGDAALTGRWDFVQAGESARIPGIAVVAGVLFPTGRPPEVARLPLATDSTGAGSFQFSAGVAVEQSWSHWFASGNVLLTQAGPRRVGTVDETLGLQLTVMGAAGYTLDNEAALALSLTYTDSMDANVNGAVVTGSGRARSQIGLSGAIPLFENWRLQGTFATDLPAYLLGRNEPANTGLSILLVRTWT